jgi:hypothetical protein
LLINNKFAKDSYANKQYNLLQVLVTINLIAGFNNLNNNSNISSFSNKSSNRLLASSVYSNSNISSNNSKAKQINKARKPYLLGYALGYFTKSCTCVAKLLKLSKNKFN